MTDEDQMRRAAIGMLISALNYTVAACGGVFAVKGLCHGIVNWVLQHEKQPPTYEFRDLVTKALRDVADELDAMKVRQ